MLAWKGWVWKKICGLTLGLLNCCEKMEKYRLVKGDITDDSSSEATAHYEIRITQQGKPRNYISRAMDLLVSNMSDEFS